MIFTYFQKKQPLVPGSSVLPHVDFSKALVGARKQRRVTATGGLEERYGLLEIVHEETRVFFSKPKDGKLYEYIEYI